MPMNDLQYRFATQENVQLLAEMNQQLIRDEGHRNKMTLPQLQERMSGWLQGTVVSLECLFCGLDLMRGGGLN